MTTESDLKVTTESDPRVTGSQIWNHFRDEFRTVAGALLKTSLTISGFFFFTAVNVVDKYFGKAEVLEFGGDKFDINKLTEFMIKISFYSLFASFALVWLLIFDFFRRARGFGSWGAIDVTILVISVFSFMLFLAGLITYPAHLIASLRPSV